MPRLRCEGLCKSFSGVTALADVTLDLPDSGITAIIGPNGAGKTTLLNVLTGFLAPDHGRCFVGVRETTGLAAHRIARLGVTRTFQQLRLVRHLTALENVLLARPDQRGESVLGSLLRLYVRGTQAQNRQESKRILALLGLATCGNMLAGELSYGQQKLLTLACCLATDRKTLFLDEPVAGVDPPTTERVIDLLSTLGSQDRQIVFVEHDIATVRRLARHLIVMDEGRVIAEGPAAAVLDRPEILEAYIGR